MVCKHRNILITVRRRAIFAFSIFVLSSFHKQTLLKHIQSVLLKAFKWSLIINLNSSTWYLKQHFTNLCNWKWEHLLQCHDFYLKCHTLSLSTVPLDEVDGLLGDTGLLVIGVTLAGTVVILNGRTVLARITTFLKRTHPVWPYLTGHAGWQLDLMVGTIWWRSIKRLVYCKSMLHI